MPSSVQDQREGTEEKTAQDLFPFPYLKGTLHIKLWGSLLIFRKRDYTATDF